MRKYLLIVDRNKASLGTRFINNLIDTIVLMIIHVILTFISGFLYGFTSIWFFYFYNNGGFLWDIFIGAMVAFIYFFLWEYYTQGMTPGKYVTGTRVISIDGQKPDRKQILQRSLYRGFLLNLFLFLDGKGGMTASAIRGLLTGQIISLKDRQKTISTVSDRKKLHRFFCLLINFAIFAHLKTVLWPSG